MSEHEMKLVLAVVKQYMDHKLRAKVMNEVPAAYNAWCGRQVVRVVRVEDGTVVYR